MSRFLPAACARHSCPSACFFLLLVAFTLLPFKVYSTDSTEAAPKLDVPFVPTPPEVVDKMLQMADIKSSDFLIDLGSGDGRIAVAAVRDYGAGRAYGVDIDPERVAEARVNAEQAGVADKVTFEVKDLFETDFSAATVLSMYLLPSINIKLRPKVLAMAPGTRVVSHAFDMGEWEADAHEHLDGRDVYYWMVPARAGGQWRLTGPKGDYAINLEQKFQKVTGTATEDGKAPLPLTGMLRGDVILLDIDNGGATPQRYMGRIRGDTIIALGNGGSAQTWRASRR